MMSKVTIKIITDPDEANRRIDNFLMTLFKRIPRQLIYKLIRKGQVRINGRRVKQDYRLRVDDKVRIPPIRSLEDAPMKVSKSFLEKLENSIIFEDDNLILSLIHI